jgi:SAM-dependent methyltransferase
VRAGYNRMAERFSLWGAEVEGDPRDRFLDELSGELPNGAAVLDLGCGAGLPSTLRLAERFRVLGVDISERQIELARANVPRAEFRCCDLLELDLPDASFDAAVALYSMSHLPRSQHVRMFGNVRRWLRPGGLFVASLGTGDIDDWTGEWLGVPMFFSSHDAAGNVALLRAAGLTVLAAEEVTMREPEGDVSFLWVVCRAGDGAQT